MTWYTETAQVASAAFAGAAAWSAYKAVEHARDAARDARTSAEEAGLPSLSVLIEHHVPSRLVSLLVVNAGGGPAKGVFVLLTTDQEYAGSLVTGFMAPNQQQRILTRLPSPGPLKDVPGIRIVVVGRDVRERIWGWDHYGERKLLADPGTKVAKEYTVDGVAALQAFWPDATFEGKQQVDAVRWSRD